MIKRLNSVKRKDHKLKIEKLIKKQIDNPKNMYKRSNLKEGELVFKEILKKEIHSKRFKESDARIKELYKKFSFNWYYVHLEMNIDDYTTTWNQIKDLIRPIVESFNFLGKNYPISDRFLNDVRENFINDSIGLRSSHFPESGIPLERKKQTISEMTYLLGKELLELDRPFVMAALMIGNRLSQPNLVNLATEKLSEYGTDETLEKEVFGRQQQ